MTRREEAGHGSPSTRQPGRWRRKRRFLAPGINFRMHLAALPWVSLDSQMPMIELYMDGHRLFVVNFLERSICMFNWTGPTRRWRRAANDDWVGAGATLPVFFSVSASSPRSTLFPVPAATDELSGSLRRRAQTSAPNDHCPRSASIGSSDDYIELSPGSPQPSSSPSCLVEYLARTTNTTARWVIFSFYRSS